MDRDEFMELVYETFADEPDNVLANGIIEAADAYVEHEKAQLSQEGATKGATSDMISRQAAIDAINSWRGRFSEEYNEAIDDCENSIRKLPTVQPEVLACGNGELVATPEPQEGYWIRTDCGLDVECKCSKCGYRDFVGPRDEYWFKRNYCPNCGAKMKGAKHESN